MFYLSVNTTEAMELSRDVLSVVNTTEAMELSRDGPLFIDSLIH